jgi:hypothetical protein
VSSKRISHLVPFLAAIFGATAFGSVSFKPAVNYQVGTNPTAVAVGDFNGDGKLDLAVVNSGDPNPGDDGSVSILLGNGDGTFQIATHFAAGKNCTGIIAGDFDRNGKDDLAVLRPGDGSVTNDGDVTIFMSNGDGTFGQGQIIPGKDPRAIVTADFNGDQRLDLAFVALDDQSINVLLGNGDGTFQSPVAYHASTATLAIAVTDVDQDGKIDLAASPVPLISEGGYFLMGNGDGTFRQGPPVIPFAAVADFNNDGKVDVVGKHCTISIFHPPGTCAFSLLLGNGDGTFQSAIAVGQPVSTTADFDGDGKLDTAGLSSDREIKIAAGKGDGTFQSPVSFPNGGSITLGTDVTGDHAPDIVMITGPNSIGILVNIGTDFSITSSTLTPSSLSASQSATSTLNLSLLTKFNNPVALSCSVQPAQTGTPTCSLNAKSVTFDSSGKANATLTISDGSFASLHDRGPMNPSVPTWFPIAGLALVGTGFSSRVRNKRMLLRIVPFAALLGLTFLQACGGGIPGGPKSTNYVITITGTSGQTSHSTTLNVTVQ